MNSSDEVSTMPVSSRRRAVKVRPAVLSLAVSLFCCSGFILRPTPAAAQDGTADQTQSIPASALVTKSVQAVGFEVGGGSTKLDLKGTDLMPAASGQAKVEVKTKAGRASIDINVSGLTSPSTFGAEFLTYVLWAVTPEGRTFNAGEIPVNKDGDGKLSATTLAQTFSLIVTAEPYFAVRIPSEMVVLQSVIRKDTKGRIFPVSQYQLMRRAQYEKLGNPLALTPDLKVAPLVMYEARNAVDVAKSREAAQYAPEAFAKAEGSLQQAESLLASKADRNTVISMARQTAQFAEDARALSVQRQEQQRIVQEREAAAAKAKAEADAKAAAEAAEAKRIADEKAAEAKREADAELAAQQAATRAAEAQKKAAEDQKMAAIREKQELRARLLALFNRVLPTTDTPRGLVVNMGDVLFDSGQSNLRPEAREALSKLSGIVLNYPSLRLAIGGYTDSTGAPEFNQALSQKRADAVQAYLVSQGLSADTLSAQGFGMADPVADNNTAKGRQMNRRVEIVVSGEVIGTQIGSKT